ncbi:MAG: methyltransferase [Phycisphaerae bacterium]
MNERHDAELFTWVDGKRFFRELPIVTHTLEIGNTGFLIDGIADAAALLDFPDYAKRFVEDNVAPYGMELWPASKMLAEWVIAERPGRGQEALELGCGLGLVSVAAARCGWQVTATDNDPTSIAFARHNAEKNGVQFASTMLLDWNRTLQAGPFERILAADVLYERMDHAPLLGCIRQLLAPSGMAAIADPNRRIADSFPETAEGLGFQVAVTLAATCNHGGEPVRGRVFRISPKPMAGLT